MERRGRRLDRRGDFWGGGGRVVDIFVAMHSRDGEEFPGRLLLEWDVSIVIERIIRKFKGLRWFTLYITYTGPHIYTTLHLKWILTFEERRRWSPPMFS